MSALQPCVGETVLRMGKERELSLVAVWYDQVILQHSTAVSDPYRVVPLPQGKYAHKAARSVAATHCPQNLLLSNGLNVPSKLIHRGDSSYSRSSISKAQRNVSLSPLQRWNQKS